MNSPYPIFWYSNFLKIIHSGILQALFSKFLLTFFCLPRHHYNGSEITGCSTLTFLYLKISTASLFSYNWSQIPKNHIIRFATATNLLLVLISWIHYFFHFCKKIPGKTYLKQMDLFVSDFYSLSYQGGHGSGNVSNCIPSQKRPNIKNYWFKKWFYIL